MGLTGIDQVEQVQNECLDILERQKKFLNGELKTELTRNEALFLVSDENLIVKNKATELEIA